MCYILCTSQTWSSCDICGSICLHLTRMDANWGFGTSSKLSSWPIRSQHNGKVIWDHETYICGSRSCHQNMSFQSYPHLDITVRSILMRFLTFTTTMKDYCLAQCSGSFKPSSHIMEYTYHAIGKISWSLMLLVSHPKLHCVKCAVVTQVS